MSEHAVAVKRARSLGLLRGVVWVSMPYAFGQVVRVIRGLVIPKLLGPAQYGLWTSLALPLPYLAYCDLGIGNQLAKRLPYTLSREGEQGYQELARKGYTWTLLTSLIGVVALVVLALEFEGPNAWFYRPGLLLLALVFVLQKIRFLLARMLVAREAFDQSAIGDMLVDGIGLLFALVLLLVLGVLGLVLALVLSELVGLAYCATRIGIPRLTIHLSGFGSMLREGVALLIIGLLDTGLMTVDQLFIIRFFPIEQFGLYSFGTYLIGLLLITSGIIFTVTQPRVMALSGRGEEKSIHEVLRASMTLFSLAIVLLAGLGIMGMELTTRLYLIDYQRGMPLYVLMAGLAIARGPVLVLRPFFLHRNAERFVILSLIAGLLLSAAFDLVAVSVGGGMDLILLSSIGAYGLTSLFLIVSFEYRRIVTGVRTVMWQSYLMSVLGILGTLFLYILWRNWTVTSLTMPPIWQSIGSSFIYLGSVVLLALLLRSHWASALRLFRSGGE